MDQLIYSRKSKKRGILLRKAKENDYRCCESSFRFLHDNGTEVISMQYALRSSPGPVGYFPQEASIYYKKGSVSL